MKKIILLTSIFASVLIFTACEKSLTVQPSPDLNSVKSGKVTGFNEWGYNWNAHSFKGILFNALIGDNLYNGAFFGDWEPYQGDDEAYLEQYPDAVYLPWAFRNVNVILHWNEALITSEGMYPDNLNDWIDSGAWMTSHYSGVDENGKRWSLFLKMVAARETDHLDVENSIWYNSDGEEIGKQTDWPQLIMIQVVKTGNIPDFMVEDYGYPFSSYKSLVCPGLGAYK